MGKYENGALNGNQITSNEKTNYNQQIPTYQNPPSMPPVKPAKSDETDK